MDIKEIKKLITLVEESKISSLMIDEDNVKVEIKKELVVSHSIPSQIPQTSGQMESGKVEVSETKSVEKVIAEERDKNIIPITSPMVGTFYTSANPESPPYVKVGDRIANGDIMCIIEAMKLFNEIEAEISGVVEKVLVNNATPIEYGQELFLIRVK